MRKRTRETRKIRSKNTAANISGNPIVAACQPMNFARQLRAAPVRLPVIASGPSLIARVRALLIQGVEQLTRRILKRRGRQHKLALLELQQLGEKRFLAIVRVGRQKFLIGGAATSVSLLAEIDSHHATVIAPRPLTQETA
jgi:hypothetical protein